MTDIRMVGVSSTIPMHDVQTMGGEAAQDQFIKEVATDLVTKLRDMVADHRPVGDLAFQVTGPHQDPLQGLIYVHTVTGNWDLDLLPPTCEAVRIHREGVETPRDTRGRIDLDAFRTRAAKRAAAKRVQP
jgi:hypothetical protein